jgi:hypothetical protein
MEDKKPEQKPSINDGLATTKEIARAPIPKEFLPALRELMEKQKLAQSELFDCVIGIAFKCLNLPAGEVIFYPETQEIGIMARVPVLKVNDAPPAESGNGKAK